MNNSTFLSVPFFPYEFCLNAEEEGRFLLRKGNGV
jgi:hypothetical protein